MSGAAARFDDCSDWASGARRGVEERGELILEDFACVAAAGCVQGSAAATDGSGEKRAERLARGCRKLGPQLAASAVQTTSIFGRSPSSSYQLPACLACLIARCIAVLSPDECTQPVVCSGKVLTPLKLGQMRLSLSTRRDELGPWTTQPAESGLSSCSVSASGAHALPRGATGPTRADKQPPLGTWRALAASRHKRENATRQRCFQVVEESSSCTMGAKPGNSREAEL